ncbi:MAG: sulfatase-like hydrolase/transferase, partial [Alphaproteobacteria bacterium]
GAAGYRTILCGRMHSIGPDQLHGFSERYVGDCSPNWLGAPRQDLGQLTGTQGPSGPTPGDNDLGSISIRRSGAGQSGYEVVDDATTDAACEKLKQLGDSNASGDDRPFLLSVGYVLPHCPFVARPADYEAFQGLVGQAALPRGTNEHPWISEWRHHTGSETPDPADIVRARTAYYGLVRALDAKIGRVLDALEMAGLAENTLVIYTSDHGEQLGDRDLWWKNTFFEESVAVPLILSWPGQVRCSARSTHVVNLVDVGATMIAAAGAQPLPRGRGRNLLSIAADERAPWVDETYSEYVTDLSSAWTGPEATQQRMLRSGRWKLVYIHGYRPQLFDLETDPHESHDLGEDPAHAEVRAWLSTRVLAGWDPAAIAREVAVRCEEKALLREWGRRTEPESQHQFTIAAGDSWLA